MKAGWRFENSYQRLPAIFFAPAAGDNVPRPHLLIANDRLARDLGLSPEYWYADRSAAGRFFCGLDIMPGMQPIAQAYAGHQFGHFTMLGDGRALLLGEHKLSDRPAVDVHLKGSGPTPYSRRGDGKAALGPMLRELIISEAMAGFGIPTTRSLAVALTGETVYRRTPEPGAVLTRIAASHLRIGTFEFARAFGERLATPHAVKTLADYAIQRHDPDLVEQEGCYNQFLTRVVKRQANLIAKWMHIGFIHGVMNTDNTSISGETIDYGPCAFMDTYDPNTVFSSIDRGGRYAFANQPIIVQWNLTRLAEAIWPILENPESEAQAILDTFLPTFDLAWLNGARAKLGLEREEQLEPGTDATLYNDFLLLLSRGKVDFTNGFRSLSFSDTSTWWQAFPQVSADFSLWEKRWHKRLYAEGIDIKIPEHRSELLQRLKRANPRYIPRNHVVERALNEASNSEGSDLNLLNGILNCVRDPFYEQVQLPDIDLLLTTPPRAEERVHATFCGT